MVWYSVLNVNLLLLIDVGSLFGSGLKNIIYYVGCNSRLLINRERTLGKHDVRIHVCMVERNKFKAYAIHLAILHTVLPPNKRRRFIPAKNPIESNMFIGDLGILSLGTWVCFFLHQCKQYLV